MTKDLLLSIFILLYFIALKATRTLYSSVISTFFSYLKPKIMKARFFTILFLFPGFMFYSIAQSGWYWQNPLPQGNRLEDTHFTDLYNGWAVGEFGTILFTDDQGATWTKQESNTTDILYAVWFHLPDNGWAVGQNGTILHWDGAVWEAQESNFTGLLYDVHFINSQTGWAVGQDATVLHTTNGGVTWTVLTTALYSQHYLSVCFLNENEGYLSGAAGSNGVIKYTDDGGATWDTEIIPANRMNAIWFEDANSGWAVGNNGALFHKSSAGGDWTLQSTGSDVNLTSVHAINPSQAWVAGEGGTIFHTNNGGDNWFAQTSNLVNNLSSVFILNGESGWVVGDKGDVSYTNNGGGTWTPQSQGPTTYLREISFSTPGLGAVVGNGGLIYLTYDNGDTWVQEESNTSQNLYAIDLSHLYIATDVLVAVGYGGTIIRKFWESDMPDEPWELQSYLHNEDLWSVDMRGYSGWAAGSFGSITFSDNAANTWEIQHQDMGYHLYDIQFPTQNYGWAVGMAATILHSRDRGDTWDEQTSPVYTNFNSVFFCDHLVGWAVGLNGTIIHTSNGGRNWEEQDSGTDEMLSDVYFTDTNNGWAVGDFGTILHTTDGGDNWNKQFSGTSNTLFSVYFSDPATGWVCGEKGTILHTTDGGGATSFETVPRLNVDKEILDLMLTEDILTIEEPSRTKAPQNYQLVGLEVSLDTIRHTAVGDLTITLSHEGVTDTLIHRSGDDGDDILKMKFSDSSSIPIDSASAPYTGVFIPFKSLSSFYGLNPYGNWTLGIYDAFNGNTGRLEAWSLKLFIGDDDGSSTFIEKKRSGTSSRLKLMDVYPNPVNHGAYIRYHLFEECKIELSLLNIKGQKLATFLSARQPAGEYNITWDASKFEPGIYFVQLSAGTFVERKKIIISRQ